MLSKALAKSSPCWCKPAWSCSDSQMVAQQELRLMPHTPIRSSKAEQSRSWRREDTYQIRPEYMPTETTQPFLPSEEIRNQAWKMIPDPGSRTPQRNPAPRDPLTKHTLQELALTAEGENRTEQRRSAVRKQERGRGAVPDDDKSRASGANKRRSREESACRARSGRNADVAHGWLCRDTGGGGVQHDGRQGLMRAECELA